MTDQKELDKVLETLKEHMEALKKHAALKPSVGRAIERLERLDAYGPLKDDASETFRLPYSSNPLPIEEPWA
jgi:uncharacterized protein YciI